MKNYYLTALTSLYLLIGSLPVEAAPVITSCIVVKETVGKNDFILKVEANDPTDANLKYTFAVVVGEATLTPNGNMATITGTKPGAYQFEVTVTNSKGESKKDTAFFHSFDPKATVMYFDEDLWAAALKKARSRPTDPAYTWPGRDTTLPDVLIIGDSISYGYTSYVRDALKGKANVYRLPHISWTTFHGRSNTHLWLGGHEWDVICFNYGLHDMKRYSGKRLGRKPEAKLFRGVPFAHYKIALKQDIDMMKSYGAKLVWTTTTFVPEGSRGRVAGDGALYNNAALEVLADYPEIAVNDLYASSKAHPEEQRNRDPHFLPAGDERNGLHTAMIIEGVLKKGDRQKAQAEAAKAESLRKEKEALEALRKKQEEAKK